MRTGQPIIGRPAWYDRNPVSKVYYYSVTQDPHTLIERFSYTCPANKKAMVEVMSCRVERRTAATTASTAMAVFNFTPSGGTGYYILKSVIYSNGVGDKEYTALGTTLMMFAGDKIQAMDYDASTGGTVDYYHALKITEFDT